MVNSSLKNAMARRNHKERAQPLYRQRLGHLEKHKDYVHRARDYKSKQDRLRKLREKAAFRNKDEFYWGMVKGKTKGGVALGDRGNEALSTDVVKLLKTQDLGYVKVQIAKDEKKIAKLRAELEVSAPAAGPSSEWSAASELEEVEKMAEMGVILYAREGGTDRKGKGKAKSSPSGHVIFADNRDELNVDRNLPPVSTEQEKETENLDLGWADPEVSRSKKVQPVEVEAEEDTLQAARDHRISLLTTLSAHLARLRSLRQAEARLATTKNLMGKGAAMKVREAGFMDDDTAKEDRNGNRKRFESKMWKWKLDRKR